VLPIEWRSACIVTLLKGIGDEINAETRVISLLHAVGKFYGSDNQQD
jgi:hypothetical protein